MTDIVKQALSESKYNAPKAIDMRLDIQSIRIELAHREYEINLLVKKLNETMAAYRKVIGLDELEKETK